MAKNKSAPNNGDVYKIKKKNKGEMEQIAGFEPALSVWKTDILPNIRYLHIPSCEQAGGSKGKKKFRKGILEKNEKHIVL